MIILTVLIAFAAVFPACAYASDGLAVSVEIPVENYSAAGKFAVFDGEREVDEIHLAQGEEGSLTLSLKSLDKFVFKVKRTAFDGSGKDAEGQIYTLHVTTCLKDGKVVWSSYAELEGTEGKAGKIAFYPAADPKPADTPQTGDGGSLLYICLAAGAAVSGGAPGAVVSGSAAGAVVSGGAPGAIVSGSAAGAAG